MFNYKTKNIFQKIKTVKRYFSPLSVTNNFYHVNRYSQTNYNYKKSSIKSYTLTHQTQQFRFHYFATEIDNAYGLITKSEAYLKTISSSVSVKEDLQFDQIDNLLQKSWISMNNKEILENFELLSCYVKKNSENFECTKYQGILEVLKSKCHEFDDKDIRHLLSCLELWKQNNKLESNFNDLWITIDKELLKRYENWSIEEILYTNDQFFKLRIHRPSDFTWYSLKKVGKKTKYMSKENLIHFVFLLKINRNIHINMYNIEYYVEQYIDELTAEELGIVAMAFLKYDTVFRGRNFICKMIEKLTNSIDTVTETSMSAIIQSLRCNDEPEYVLQFDKLFDALETQVSKRSLTLLSYVFLLQRKILTHHKNFTLKTLERYEKEIENATATDIERILLTLYTFNYDPKITPFYSIAMKELLSPRKAKQLAYMPRLLVFATEHLLGVNYLSEEALNIIMQPEYIDKAANGDKYTLNREYLAIDYSLEIEHPEYSSPRLNEDLKLFFIKRFGTFYDKTIQKFQKILSIHKIIPDIVNICKQIYGPELVHFDALLPHHPKTMIVLCLDSKTNEIVSSAEKLSEYQVSSIKYAPKDGNKWYALVAGPRIHTDRKTLEPFGPLKVQLRQLEKIGYIPILIPIKVWSKFSDDNEKQNYLKKLLDR